ncbi:HNH endonuclease [Thermovibrio sp.]
MVLHPVLVLDKAYSPTTIFSHKKAFLLDYLGRCEVLQYYREVVITSPGREFRAPLLIRIPILTRNWESSFPTRRAIFIRDNFTCAYCGKALKDSEATVDHVVPKSRGGKWEWENLITCCKDCNQRKGNRTPEEAQMELLFKPKKPSSLQVAVNYWRKRIDREFEEVAQMFGVNLSGFLVKG